MFLLIFANLSSCTVPEHDIDIRIQSLEAEVASLRLENANLKTENDLLKQWWILPTETTEIEGTGIFWDNTTFSEWSNQSCIQTAEAVFIQQGNTECKNQGYTDIDIQNGECTISIEVIEKLQAQKKQNISQCNP